MVKAKKLSSLWFIKGLLILSPFFASAYSCPDLPKLSLQQCGHYDFIAYGRIDSELDCDDEQFLFTPINVFKGESAKGIDLYTKCQGDGLAVSKGEYWILFGKMNNSLEVQLSFCGHSRKQLPVGEKDYEAEVRGTSFSEDLAFLKNSFNEKKESQNELKARKYEKVDPVLVPILLGVGLVFMVVGYFFIKRLK